ncbi:MAG: hypothetical protein AAB940_00360 [Patescibacteria group bacterium]
MDLSFKKFKLISKEKKRDALYMAATLIIVILITGIFIFSLNIVLRAIDAAFVIGGEDVSSEILSFNLDDFAKVASRLGISFNPSEVLKENIVPAPIIEQPAIISSPQSTSTQESVSI